VAGQSGAGDNPVVLKLLAVVGRNPDVAAPAKAKARLTAIMADKGYAYGKETGWLSARWGCSISWPVRASEGDCG
jgi:hypothetical protein